MTTMYARLLCISLLLIATLIGPIHADTFNRTAVVPATGDRVADGDALISELERLYPIPDEKNRWLVRLEPGTYDVGTTAVVMREYVDIEGSGTASTTIYGSVAPPPGYRLGGLVEGASNTELRSLTITCESDDKTDSCQGMSLHTASPRLTQVRFQVRGTGSGPHWGIRSFDSQPVLQEVDIHVITENSGNNFGIVLGGISRLDIDRSEIVVRGALNDNFAIVLREQTQNSAMSDSSVVATGGRSAMGIAYLNYYGDAAVLLEDTIVSAFGGTNRSRGISVESPASGRLEIWLRGSRVHGDTDGVNLPEVDSTIQIVNSEIFGTRTGVRAGDVRIRSTWLRGGGTVQGQTVRCVAVYDDAFNFYASGCPQPR